MKNSDMPAMPQSGAFSIADDFYPSENMGGSGLTKRETFAMNAPTIPPWFELEFLQNKDLNGSIDYLVVSGSQGTTSQEGYKAMFFAWPVYYANQVLKQLDEKS